MTDYRLKTEKTKHSQKKENFANRKKVHSVIETRDSLISKNQESEGLVSKFRDVTKKYRADITVKDPSTFAFYGSAKSYYEDSFYNIINYYPYDGSKKEVLQWYENASPLDVGILQNHWPSFVGHLAFDEDEFVSFYAGPQSITESTYIGQYLRGQTGLTLDPEKGNTVEFWFKKDGWSASQEVVFDIGTYPGKVSSGNSGQFKLYLSNSSGSPLYVDYTLGTLGVSDQNIGSSNVTKSSVGDGNWHHYALKVYQEDTTLYLKLYIDGEHDSTTTASVSAMTAVDTYMGGCIGAAQAASSGDLSGSVDEFRFWKGKRSSRQISRFFDQKLFASETEESDYTTRLGLYYRFNKPAIGVTSKDEIVVDYSGNDITGLINNYNTNVRVPESGITNSSVSTNTELKDPSLDAQDSNVAAKKDELVKIGESYDINNPSYIRNFVPDWVFDSNGQGLSNENSQVSLLFQMIAQEFDEIRLNLDGKMNERTPRFERASQDVFDHDDTTGLETSSSYSNNYFLGCDDNGSVYIPSWGNHSGFPIEKIENVGIKVLEKPLINAELDEELDRIVNHVSITKPVEEIRRAILENVYSSAKHILRRKGTERSFDSILSSYGIDKDLISYNVYGRNAETFIDDTRTDFVPDEKNSVYFGQNTSSTIFLSGTNSNERTYLTSDSAETEYTFEGTFIFPERRDFDHEITESSIFGLAEVSASNNDLTFTSPNNADFQVKVVKDGVGSDDAKFTLTSVGGIISDLETDLIQDVYNNSRWNIALRVVKDVGNKFVSSSAPSYKVELVGHNYILDSLQNSFTLSASLSTSEYNDFRQANKTIYIGAERANITGSVTTNTDVKIIDFNAWNDSLTDLELQARAKSPSKFGRRSPHTYRDNYDTSSDLMSENRILSLQFDAISELTANNNILITDASSGSADQVTKYGQLIGSKYPAKSTTFSSGLSNVIQREFLPVIRDIPIGNTHGSQGVEIKDAEINKFDLSSRPQSKLFSFEKSMYQAVSREMVSFLGGVTSFNNLIGEPVYKYRKNYKMLEHLRQKFYETVESESQFERFVSYFRWIDKSIGHFLEQLVPATATTNTGIEDVIESHALERNKYDHKAPLVERKEYDSGLETNLLAINELLYDWEHGHHSSDEADHCLWQRDRKERTGDRETLRKVLTTVVSGSTYVLRNLVKPYRYTVDKQTLLNIGSNRNATKNKDLYKIVNEGKEITIDADDIYEFKSCNDVINPQEEKLYTAKTNTTETDDYLDADADMILPFSLYSSSVGEDFSDFKQNLKITNNHDGVPALQSPFVREFVGGLPHRSVKFGTADADRPEAYDISSSATTLTIKQTTAPKSMFHRDLGGARFYHIGNVKTTETPLVIGNYSKEYEIVMTNGRSLNNNYLVENEGLNLTGALVASQFISGAADFYVPERPARDHVIVNRFAAPGGPEQAGAYGLDRESAEYSVYNTVNYRNPIVRDVENLLSAENSEQFGYRSGSAVQASKHMTNRNPRKFTGSLGEEFNYDNNFVQHEIPQTDFGYAWITASANESVYSFLNKNENAGHQHLMNISGSLKSSETISFLEQGERVIVTGYDEASFMSPGPGVYGLGESGYFSDKISFNYNNLYIAELINFDTNTLGVSSFFPLGIEPGNNSPESEIREQMPFINPTTYRNGVKMFGAGFQTTGIGHTEAAMFNSTILNRQGPYGWPSWKQIRGEQHPIVKNHKKNNKLSIVYRETSGKKYASVDSMKGDYSFDYGRTVDDNTTRTSSRVVQNYDEMFITSKFNPLNVNLTAFNRSSLSLESLDRVLRLALAGARDRIAEQAGQFMMWINDEYYLSNVAQSADQLLSGLSLDEQDKFTFFNSDGAISEEFQDEQARVLNILRDSAASSMRASTQNNTTGFAQRQLEELVIADDIQNPDLWTKYINKEKYASDKGLSVLKNFIIEGARSNLTRELNYVETIYPREINTYKLDTRFRSNFDFFGWNSTRSNRNLILTGNVSYDSALINFSTEADVSLFFPSTPVSEEESFKTAFYDRIEIVDVNSTGSSAAIASSTNITSSTWVLDSRATFTATPVNLTSSFFTDGDSFLSNRSQGTRGEGILQNDYSIFAMGYNGLRGAPPMSILYNRRIPQQYGTDVYLAGEAKWEAADSRTGPFYDSYQDYAEGLKSVGQTYSLIPEFRVSRVYEDFINSKDVSDLVPDDFLELTGAVYHTSSGDLSVGTEFFKTYSMTDFMKYFQPVRENIEQDELGLAAGRLTLRCQAVKKFLPYRGFYPAERVVQISEIFDRSYLREGSYDAKYIQNSSISSADAQKYLKLRIENSKAQAIKPLMAPGVLLNSIKAGLAVDYPIFSSSVSAGVDYIFDNVITSSLNDFSSLSLGSTTAFTGSLVNSTEDEGIPRLSGSVDYRVTFEDLLYPSTIWDKIVYDNEPHPSASMMYGLAEHLKVLDRPVKFGNIDRDMSVQYGAMDFETSRQHFDRSMKPYQSAVHNFCAETVNFFLEDGQLNTMISAPGAQYFDAATYKMRVYLTNEDTVMYDRHSAFGPPVDEGDPEVTRYELTDTTIQGVAASASITFNNGGSVEGISGSTITIEDYQSNASTYEFIADVTGIPASASIEFSGISDPYGTLSGSTITLEDSSGTTKTFQFCPTTAATTASFDFDFNQIHADRYFHFTTYVTASEFRVQPTPSALVDGFSSGKYEFHPQGNVASATGFQFNDADSQLKKFAFYDPESYYSGRISIDMINASGYNAQLKAALDATSANPPQISLVLVSGSEEHAYRFFFFDSDTQGGTIPGSAADSDSVGIDTTVGPNPYAKTGATIAGEMISALNTHFFTGSLGGNYFVTRSSNTSNSIHIFSKTYWSPGNHAEHSFYLTCSYESAFGDHGSTAREEGIANAFTFYESSAKSILSISTGSYNPGTVVMPDSDTTHNVLHRWNPDAVPIYSRSQIASRANKTLVGLLTQSFGSSTTRYVSVRDLPSSHAIGISGAAGEIYIPTGSISGESSSGVGNRVVTALADAVYEIAGTNGITASVPSTNTARIHRTATGSFTNSVSTTLTGFTADIVVTPLSVDIGTVDSAFAGGADAVSFTNGATLPNNGNTIIEVASGATTTDLAINGNQVFGSGLDLTSTRTNTTINLTQDTVGTAGNTTIGESGFVSDGGSITQFAGGIDTEDYTTGNALGNGNIAVVIGTKNDGGTPGNDTYLTNTQARNQLNSAIGSQQGSTLTRSTTSTLTGPVLLLTQKGTGSAGNNAITDDSFQFVEDDIIGFAGGVDFVQGTLEMTPTAAIQSSSHGFLPYVPPFLDPNTSPYAELSFTPTREAEYTIDQVLENLEITYYNMPEPSNASSNINYQEAMVLSASIDLKGQVKLRSDHVNHLVGGKAMLEPETSNLSRWVIRPKWETPIIDFSNVSASALDLSDNTVTQVSGSPWKTRYQSSYYEILNSSSSPYLTASTGMWHQSGTLISELANKGYYLVIESGDLDNRDSYGAKDLARKVGFLEDSQSRTSVKLGAVAQSKIVSEAVVAIPFYNDPEDGIKFFNLNQESLFAAITMNNRTHQEYNAAISEDQIDAPRLAAIKAAYEDFYNAPGSNGVENIAYQLRMMEKFIIPPQFDFITLEPECANVQPFVQYIFQFNAELTEEDLTSMWQNLYPNSQSGPGAASHSNPLFNYSVRSVPDTEFISGFLDVEGVGMFQTMTSNYENVSEFLQNEVRWMVFKCKQRGMSNYKELIAKSLSRDNLSDLHSIDGREFDYRRQRSNKLAPHFNWPYDYFSLVELGKIESKVDFFDDVGSVGIPKESGFTTTTSKFTAAEQQGGQPLQFTIDDQPSSGGSSSVNTDSMVFREVLLADTTVPTSRVFTITGGVASSGTEQLYVNGVLQSLGSSNDYTISGNTVTFTYDLEAGDSVVVSYIKE